MRRGEVVAERVLCPVDGSWRGSRRARKMERLEVRSNVVSSDTWKDDAALEDSSVWKAESQVRGGGRRSLVFGFDLVGFESSRGGRLRGLSSGRDRSVGWREWKAERRGRDVSWDFADKTVRAVRSVTGRALIGTSQR